VKLILRFWSGVTILKVTEICVGLTTAGTDWVTLDWFTKTLLLSFLSGKRRWLKAHQNPLFLPIKMMI
jgi:hypothetical protein